MTYTPPPPSWPTPAPTPVDYQALHGMMIDRDVEHLRILSICWYVMSGILALMGCIPIIHLTMGLVMVLSPSSFGPGTPPPPIVGWVIVAVAGGFILFGWTAAALGFMTAFSLPRRRRIVVCYVAAALACMQIPIGTTLGVFTFVVLGRPSIKASFAASAGGVAR